MFLIDAENFKFLRFYNKTFWFFYDFKIQVRFLENELKLIL